MLKRVAAGRREGFFKSLVEGDAVAVVEDDGVVEGRLEVGEELEEGVFRVERVVERRKRKVSCSCTEFALLYFDYFRGEWSVWRFGTGLSGRRLLGSGRIR